MHYRSPFLYAVLALPFAIARLAWSEDAPPVSPVAPAAQVAPGLRLLDAGREPRAPLRFRVPKGRKSKGTVTMRMRLEQDGEPFRSVGMRFGMGMEALDLSPERVTTARVRVEQFEVVDVLDEAMRKRLEADAAHSGLTRLEIVMQVTERGQATDVK